jgi:hypothetical protein
MKIKAPKKPLDLSKIFTIAIYATYILSALSFLVPVGVHFFTGGYHLNEIDIVRLSTVFWIGIALMNFQSSEIQRKIRFEAERILSIAVEQNTQLNHVNTALIKILDNIDKKVLKKHGIAIKVHKERIIN